MKIQCNVCEKTEASVLCCADEAALCWACDEKVHAANKLASKHQRVPLSTSTSQIPKCDVCQEAAGFFFCLEDRALLCRKCDVAIHSANSYVSAHQRFLLTGVKVGLEPSEPGPSSSSVNSQYGGKMSETKPPSISKGGQDMPISNECNESPSMHINGVRDHASSKMPVPFSGGFIAGNIPQWNMDVDEFLGYNDFNHPYGYIDHGSSQADSGKLGDSDCSSMQRGSDGAGDECLGQVRENSWSVPQMPSPPTASGLYWPNSSRHLSEIHVPDICCSHDNAVSSLHYNRTLNMKRRRHT